MVKMGGNAAHVAVVDSKREKILLLRRQDLLVWVMPGGHLEEGESFEKAAIREVKEETGLKVKLTDLVGEYGFRGKYFKKKVFRGLVIGGRLRGSDESVAIDWFGINNLPSPMTWYETVRVNDALKYHGQKTEREMRISVLKELVFQLRDPGRLLYLLAKLWFRRLKKRF